MSKCLFCRPVDIRATQEEMIGMLLHVEFRPLLEYYRAVLKDDPAYLDFHNVSTSLHLCAALKLHDFPRQLVLERAEVRHCNVVKALEEALNRMDTMGAIMQQSTAVG